jgi:hypothetical protein
VALAEQKLDEWLSRPLHELDRKVVMLDGIHFRDHCILVFACKRTGTPSRLTLETST